MTKSTRLLLYVLIMLALVLAGCSGGQVPQGNGASGDAGAGAGDDNFPVTFVDSLGREVTVGQQPAKVVSLSPAITEILFAIGAGDKIAGVTDYCEYPPEALAKPKVGGFEDPNMELIIELDPDLIFVAAGIQEEFVQQFHNLGMAVVVLDAETVEEVLHNIQLAGLALGQVEEAGELVAQLAARINAVKETVAKAAHQPTVFFEVWDDPLMTAGPGSFIDDLIRLAGGRNIASDAAKRYAEFSLEVLLERDPEVYLIQDHAHQPEDVMARAGYEGLSAVRNGRVAAVKDDWVTLPGPRIVDGLEAMAKILHPDLFE
ncbi:MAG TPA: cobalamin-binding protein [Clostridia bacterium]|nr:cobalamin-binding protein [Clostridia bacterium]